jgi:hypothetical protein
MTKHFIAAALSHRTGYGYWRFVGNSVDDKGEFVSFESSAEQELFKQDLGTTVQQEIDNSKAEFKGLRQSFTKYFPAETQTKDRSDTHNSNKTKGD